MLTKFGAEEVGGFKLEQIRPDLVLDGFDCSVPEYNDYLIRDALRSAQDNIALTWLLRKRETGEVAAYMSLVLML